MREKIAQRPLDIVCDPDRRPQTMGALEYELTKSAKGRGSAVAAVLGLKAPADDGLFSSGAEESSYRRGFDGPRKSSQMRLYDLDQK